MAFNIDITTPGNTDLISTFPANERAMRTDLEGMFTENHEEATGDHTKIGMKVQGGDPALDGTLGFLYTKTISGQTELFYKDDVPNVVQLTDGGSASPDKVAKAGDTMTGTLTLDGVAVFADFVNGAFPRVENTFGLALQEAASGPYRSGIKMTAADEVEVGDPQNVSVIQSSGATDLKADYGGSGGLKTVWHEGNTTGAGSGLDTDLVQGFDFSAALNVSAKGHYTLPGGLIVQWGSVVHTGLSTAETFDLNPFPGAFYSIAITQSLSLTPPTDNVTGIQITGLSTSGFTITAGTPDECDGTYYYIALGN